MFLELIATFVAGFAGAGLVLLLNKLLRGRLPRWLMPVGAGLAMLAATISNEYGWYPRTKANLPEGMVIVETVENRALFRPWTYIAPFTERFIALDKASLQTNSAQPDWRMADIYLFGRWSPIHKIPVLADCAGARRAPLTEGASFETDGSVKGAVWSKVSPDDATLVAMCGA